MSPPPRSDPSTVLARIAIERARMVAPAAFIIMLVWLVVVAIAGRVSFQHLVLASVLCAAVGVIALLLMRRSIGERWGHPTCFILWWAAVISSLAGAYSAPEPMYAILLALEILASVLLLDTRWVIGSLLAVQAIWIPLSLRESAHDAVIYILTAVTAEGFALVLQIVLRRAIVQQVITAADLAHQLDERVRLEEQLFHSQRMEAVGTLAAGLAHDMNNVLASITNLVSLLDDEVASPWGRADLEQIVAQALRGAELTRGLLAFSRRGQYRKQPVRVDDIVLDVRPLLDRTLPRTIVIRDWLSGAERCVEGDPTQLGQTLINLCLNAADAMAGDGTITITTAIVAVAGDAAAALALAPGWYARLEVSDTGTGMDEPTRHRVFEPFFTTKREHKRTGLGLSAVWGIVQAHHGAIGVESSLGHGSTFVIHLPVTADTYVVPEQASAPPASLQRTGTVLVVDDELAVRSGTVRMLQRAGLSAIQAANGDEALRQYSDHAEAIDLVILDMAMPVMGGRECFRKLRERSQVPVLIATGYAIDADVQDMLANGARLIEKPYRANDLLREVAGLLGPLVTAARIGTNPQH